MTNVVQIIDAEGQAVGTSPVWFDQHDQLGSEALTIVSILGAQASGKSTLLNSLFGTNFSVAARSSIATATTKGIYAATDASNDSIVALDVEGSDSRERGRDGRIFHSRLAAFVTAVSDAIIVNIWYHDLGRWDAAGYTLLNDIFSEAVKIASLDESGFHTRLIFTIRDVDAEADSSALEDVLFADLDELFAKVIATTTVNTTATTGNDDGADDVETRAELGPTGSMSVRDLFDLTCIALPHMRHNGTAFNEAVENFSKTLKASSSEGGLIATKNSKGIPADGCGTFTRGLWQSQYASRSANGNGEDDSGDASGITLMAAFKCNEAFSEALSDASSAMKALSANTLDAGEKIDSLGVKAADIMNNAMSAYDEATEEFKEESIQARKRRELESIIDTQQQAMFMKQIQVLRENALTHFKSVTAADDMPSDLAFYTADSQFLQEAEEAKRPGCSWNANQERTDLQNMMQEISTQRKRLLTSQVTAAQHQAHALQYLQMQQSQMNAIQAQAYGGGGAGQWNVGAAYRPPDTNINASLSYQQGRTNIQISMVPDESASLLGPNGFTSGVGPGNLGLSFNIGL